jgi:hypothetical protein
MAAPVHCTCSTLPAGLAAIPAANIMPTAALAPTAKFATAEAAAADVSIATAAAYFASGVTIVDDAEMVDITVKAVKLGEKHSVIVEASSPAVASVVMPAAALAATTNFSKAEAVAADVSIATVAAYSVSGVTITDDAELGDITVKAEESGKKNSVQ